MPFYAYICENCDSKFESFASIQKKTSGWKPDCPNCGNSRTRQTFSPLTVSVDIKKPTPMHGCCGSRKGESR